MKKFSILVGIDCGMAKAKAKAKANAKANAHGRQFYRKSHSTIGNRSQQQYIRQILQTALLLLLVREGQSEGVTESMADAN